MSMVAFCQRVRQSLAHATFAQRRQLVELLIDRVVVTDGDVEIHYVIPTTPASEHVRFRHVRTNYLLPFPALSPAWHLAQTLHCTALHCIALSASAWVATPSPVRASWMHRASRLSR